MTGTNKNNQGDDPTTALRTELSTVVAIPVTPFDDTTGAIDDARYTALLQRLVDADIRAITPNGNTSEFYALSPEERRHCIRMAGAFAGSSIIIAGVGHDIPTAQEEAELAADCRAQCIMVHQPVHPYRSIAGWVDYHAEIAAAVPGLGVIPYIRDPALDSHAIGALLERVPNIVAVKYAIRDPRLFAGVVTDLGQDCVAWVCGLAEDWAPFFAAAGATGFTSGLVNVDPGLSLRMLAALRAGDNASALRLWQQTRAFERLRADRQSENNVSVVKEALAQLGLCSRAVRPPCTPLDEARREAVSDVLRAWSQAASPAASR